MLDCYQPCTENGTVKGSGFTEVFCVAFYLPWDIQEWRFHARVLSVVSLIMCGRKQKTKQKKQADIQERMFYINVVVCVINHEPKTGAWVLLKYVFCVVLLWITGDALVMKIQK